MSRAPITLTLTAREANALWQFVAAELNDSTVAQNHLPIRRYLNAVMQKLFASGAISLAEQPPDST